jgi:predicted nucleic acid-binding protein
LSVFEDAVWDTTLASRVQPGSDVYAYVQERAARGVPVVVASVALAEMASGYRKQADRGDARYARLIEWLHVFVDSAAIVVAPLDALAALAYGQARRRHPAPPTSRRARRHPTRGEHRAAWLHDLQIAATAWSHGLPVITENTGDLQLAGELIAQLYPAEPPLEVLDGGELALP